MTTSGEFVSTPRTSVWPLRIGLGAALVAATASVLAVAALFLWIASLLVPVALVAGVIAYVAFRLQAPRAASLRTSPRRR